MTPINSYKKTFCDFRTFSYVFWGVREIVAKEEEKESSFLSCGICTTNRAKYYALWGIFIFQQNFVHRWFLETFIKVKDILLLHCNNSSVGVTVTKQSCCYEAISAIIKGILAN